jgi:hypothetical protein
VEAHTRSPRDLFEGKEHYEIPAFQRPYVWTEEDQWAPLWDDVSRVAEAYVTAKEADPEADVEAHHFLGAVVYESKQPIAGDVTRHDVIDGQQRMTTLQLLLDAAHEVVHKRGHEDLAESLEELILNGSPRFAGKRERFKLWPSQADRKAFEFAMDHVGTWSGEHQMVEAHRFFRAEAERWILGKPDDDGTVPPGTEELRVEALSSTLQDRLVLVAIDLTGHDDSQLIFETLNDRGTPLLKADLIKNWLFRKGERLGADVDAWAEAQWAEFDTTWWRSEIKQGRLTRSRVDIFLQYWLTMRRLDEVKTEHAFRVFTEYAEPLMTSATAANALLDELRRDADTYRDFAQLDESTPEGRFYSRVIERLELAVTTPVFLWMLSKNHNVPADQLRSGLEALESWAIRRTLLRLTTKDANRFAVAILKMLDTVERGHAGDALSTYLAEQTAETRVWPSDHRVTTELPRLRMYGSLRQDRLRVVFGAVEQHLRDQSTMYEAVQLPSGLEIEHVMPQGWRTHWDPEPKLNLEAAAERDRIVNTLGNLTLVTKSLNGSLSNRPWTDAEAASLKEGGEPGKGKRTLLDAFSLLVLNKAILSDHLNGWTEDDINARAIALTATVCAVWPGPSTEVQQAAFEASTGQPAGELNEVPWTGADITRLADEAGETLLIVLDTLASDPSRKWQNSDFVDAQLTDRAYAALGALTNKVRGSFGRSNVPVQYNKVGTTWSWYLNEDFATLWRQTRDLTS